MSRTSRLTMVEQGFHISIRQQCELLGINRSGYYYRPIINNVVLLRFVGHFFLVFIVHIQSQVECYSQ